MGERHETNRRNSDRAPRRRAPFRSSSQGSGTEIEYPIVGQQVAVTNIERLVIDEQADELAISHVDQRLARLRSPVLALGFQQRAQFIETVQIRSRQPMWLAFVKIASHANVAVGESEK